MPSAEELTSNWFEESFATKQTKRRLLNTAREGPSPADSGTFVWGDQYTPSPEEETSNWFEESLATNDVHKLVAISSSMPGTE